MNNLELNLSYKLVNHKTTNQIIKYQNRSNVLYQTTSGASDLHAYRQFDMTHMFRRYHGY